MLLKTPAPIIYLITSGETTPETTSDSEEIVRLLELVRAAVAAGVSLIQLREKSLTARTLFSLTERAAEITRGTASRLLVNDRADIASAAGADGVHLTTRSLEAAVVRRLFGADFLIGVSTHTLAEAESARRSGSDFATFGPVFETPSKRQYGLPPAGLDRLREAARALAPFPLLALGGITLENARDTLLAGASGVAAIRLFGEPHELSDRVRAILDSQTAPTAPAHGHNSDAA